MVFNFYFFAFLELECFLSVCQSFVFFVVVNIHCLLYFESDIFLTCFMSSGILRLLTFFLEAVSVYKYLPYTVVSFFFLDSSFFGFCETDLQGASKSSGMFFLNIIWIYYCYFLILKGIWCTWGMFSEGQNRGW